MAYQTIIFEIADAVATLALNRPDKLNAFTGEMHEELRDALAATREGGARVLVIAAVNGVAAGAGANFALAADLVFAARSASFLQAFVKIGLVPDAGGTFFLPRLIGPQRAMALAVTGDRIDAETAAAWGMIYKCVDDDALIDEVTAFARHLATQPTRTIGIIKRLMKASATNDLAAQLALERDAQREAGEGNDYREGVQAFLEKRAARFTGT